MLNVGINLWRTSITHGGPIAPDLPAGFPPDVSGTQATIAADFTVNAYWAGGASKASFAQWLAAIGGTYTRSSSATYLQGGVVKTAAANTLRFPTSLAGVAQGIRLTTAATNSVLQSNNFTYGIGAWGGGGLPTVVQNVTGPDGIANSAWTWTATSNQVRPYQSIPTVAGPSTLSAFVKIGNTSPIFAELITFDAGGAAKATFFNLATGAAASVNVVAGGAPTWNHSNPRITPLANGWFLVSVMTDGPTAIVGLGFSNTDGMDGLATVGQTGLAYGVQLTNTAFPFDYIPTTTATVTQATDTLTWPYTQKVYSGLVAVNDQTFGNYQRFFDNTGGSGPWYVNPDGTLHAFNGSTDWGSQPLDLTLPSIKAMIAGNASSTSYTSKGQTPQTAANPLCALPNQTSMRLGYEGQGNYSMAAWWDNLVASSAELQRLTAPPVLPLTIANASINADFAGNVYAVAGAAKADFAAWLAAISGTYTRSSTATYLQGGVVKTAAANAPRFPTSLAGVAQGLRLTGAATNLLIQSQNIAGVWAPGSCTFGSGISAPDGTTTATSVTGDSSTGGQYFYTTPSLAAGTYTCSMYFKAGTASYGYISISDNTSVYCTAVFDLTGGHGSAASQTGTSSGQTIVSSSLTPLANGWYRATFTFTLANATTFLFIGQAGAATGNTFGASGIPTPSPASAVFYAWAGQITSTAFECDYIPTTSVTVTQAADNLNFPYAQTTFSALVNTNGMTKPGSGEQQQYFADAGSNALVYNSGGSNSMTSWNSVAGSLASPIFTGGFGVTHKMMLTGSPSARSFTIDGAVPNSDIGPVDASMTTAYIGSAGSTQNCYGNIGQVALWNGRVASVADMQRLTT